MVEALALDLGLVAGLRAAAVLHLVEPPVANHELGHVVGRLQAWAEDGGQEGLVRRRRVVIGAGGLVGRREQQGRGHERHESKVMFHCFPW